MITEAHKPHHLPYNNIHLIIHEVTQQIIASIFYLKKKNGTPQILSWPLYIHVQVAVL